MRARATTEEHRAATPLELFFDLCFVVAVAQAGTHLHHALAERRVAQGVVAFAAVFFAIWWAWMNFTWFASAYDTEDTLYRLAVLVQIGGALIIAAGVGRAFDHHDFTVMTLGYVVMRVALVGLWLRAGRGDPERRRCTRRYAIGVTLCELGWISLLALPPSIRIPGFLLLVPAELLVPVVAERAGATPWHPGHVAERYGLFTLIVLGESVLAASLAIGAALDAGTSFARVATVAAGGLLVVFSMWWVYFDLPAEHVVRRARTSFGDRQRSAFAWGYGHFLVFGGAAAVGAGLQVAVDRATGASGVSDPAAGAAVTVPVTIYLVVVWLLHASQKPRGLLRSAAVPLTAALILASTWLPEPVLATGLILATLVGVAAVAHAAGT